MHLPVWDAHTIRTAREPGGGQQPGLQTGSIRFGSPGRGCQDRNEECYALAHDLEFEPQRHLQDARRESGRRLGDLAEGRGAEKRGGARGGRARQLRNTRCRVAEDFMIGQIVRFGAEAKAIAFVRKSEGFSYRRVVIPGVKPPHNAAVSDLARIAGYEVGADRGVRKEAWNTELIELESARRNRTYARRENAERRYVVIGVVLVR